MWASTAVRVVAGRGSWSQPGCGPQLALEHCRISTPIVNDPGEGSQAKRRGHAVVLDHLTPPLGRAGLHGDLQRLEGLLDELVEVRQLGGERTQVLETQVLSTLQDLDWPGVPSRQELKQNPERFNSCLDQAETYLCELKESQIRTGLHRYGHCPDDDAMGELLMALARPPLQGQPGLTQLLAREAGLALDPWVQEDGEPLDQADQLRLEELGCQRCRRVGDGTAWLDPQALLVIRQLVFNDHADDLVLPFQMLIQTSAPLKQRCRELWQRLKDCGNAEREGLAAGSGGRRSPPVLRELPAVVDPRCCRLVAISIPWICVDCRRKRPGISVDAPPNGCWIFIFRRKESPCGI